MISYVLIAAKKNLQVKTTTRNLFWIGILSQIVWGLVGTSYQEDPLYVGGFQHHQHNLTIQDAS